MSERRSGVPGFQDIPKTLVELAYRFRPLRIHKKGKSETTDTPSRSRLRQTGRSDRAKLQGREKLN